MNNNIFLTVLFTNIFKSIIKLKNQKRATIVFFLILFFPQLASTEIKNFETSPNEINYLIKTDIKSSFSFSGLATFYNGVAAYIVSDDEVRKLNDKDFYKITKQQSLAIIGHYKVMIVDSINADVSFKNDKLAIEVYKNSDQKIDLNVLEAKILLKSDLIKYGDKFQKLKYAHLWEPLRLLSIGIEAIFLWLNSIHVFGWGVTIILSSLIFKIFILPINIFLVSSQRKVSNIQASLETKLENIKSNFSGEEAHNKFMQAHKEKGVTPFYNLRPLFLTIVPIPFLISIFNVLGELDLISGHSFLWIKDLAYPDAIFQFKFYIPLLGNSINPLPILMTLFTLFAAIFHKNHIVSVKELRRQKLNLYFITFGIFLLFYPFPSAMVLYWTFATLWQLVQQRFIRI